MADPFVLLEAAAETRADARGSLAVLYESSGVVLKRSFSARGVFRGLHLQVAPHPQTKLIRVISGRILDFVADPAAAEVELRWRDLAPGDGWVLIASRFAHGFYALEDCWFEYVCEGAYHEASERSYSIADFLQHELRLPAPRLSAKDAAAPRLAIARAAPAAGCSWSAS